MGQFGSGSEPSDTEKQKQSGWIRLLQSPQMVRWDRPMGLPHAAQIDFVGEAIPSLPAAELRASPPSIVSRFLRPRSRIAIPASVSALRRAFWSGGVSRSE